MSMFLLSRRWGIVEKSSSVMVRYVPKSARTNALVDKTLMAPPRYQRMFLSWRQGTLFLQVPCICGERWHRGHISCLPKIVLSDEHNVKYMLSRAEELKNLCEIDFLLNIQEWDLAYENLEIWSKKLGSMKSNTNFPDSREERYDSCHDRELITAFRLFNSRVKWRSMMSHANLPTVWNDGMISLLIWH
jgi:hypothetical protein